ncbi:MAG TPA: NADPH-dependent FMN reductase [Bryobacteraceae bacterium]|nr:NADPH-dependent FMN reductase [Bryobacteraceae bacterium]
MSEKEPVTHIAGICGSLRAGSYTRRAVECALAGAAEAGADTNLIDLRNYQLIFRNGKDETGYPEDVFRLRKDVGQADGVIVGTPEYHGSFSGVIKNALDLMGFEEFEGKMIGLVGVSGGRMGAFDAMNSLRNIGRALHAWVIPEQASVPEAWKVFADDGSITDPQLEERLKQVGRQVARFARLHKCENALEFVKNWQQAQANPGG